MKRDFQVLRGANYNWIVLDQAGMQLLAFDRRGTAEAYGKALAHRAKVSLVVHHCDRTMRYSERDLTYSVRL